MQPTLVRVLSTGRTGTKFIARVFADQGYESRHEDLYAGEPGVAIIEYMKSLGDTWYHNPKQYYRLETDFSRPYLRTVKTLLGEELNPPGFFRKLIPQKLTLRKTESNKPPRYPVVIDCSNRLTLATPIIFRTFLKAGLQVKNLILFRNPLKTIHAIFKVEAPNYWTRPQSFVDDAGVLGAASVWANVYLAAHDQMMHLGEDNFRLLKLESFTWDLDLTRDIFSFLTLTLNEDRYLAFRKRTLGTPYRSRKHDSTRNSDLFHDPDFVFSDEQISQVLEKISPVLDLFMINHDETVQEYKEFHELEKPKLNFE